MERTAARGKSAGERDGGAILSLTVCVSVGVHVRVCVVFLTDSPACTSRSGRHLRPDSRCSSSTGHIWPLSP